ncbi:F-box only protein 44-like [Littorina saxatilis]|uniref:F-box only protein 44-like n=1 Tax=Littorina saxatilis TaxID=31220 RepID=UPI0038B4A37F
MNSGCFRKEENSNAKAVGMKPSEGGAASSAEQETALIMGSEASTENGKEVQYCGFDIRALPDELFMHVLMFVPPADVVKRCSLVCKHWLAVSRDQSMWRRKCEQEGKYVPSVKGLQLTTKDFMRIYFKNPYGRNLLRNTHAQSMEYWYKPGNYLSASVETSPAGADPIADFVPPEEIQGKPVQNWVTSYQFTTITQQVHLLEEGCSTEVLDNVRPPIYASAWCAARWDCGAKFQLVVKLLNKDQTTVDAVEKEMIMSDHPDRRIWHKVEHTFTDYKPGVRSIKFQMGGVDTQFWAGNYGSKFTLPCLRFIFSKKDEDKH